MPLPNPSMDFTPFDPLTAAELDDIVENVEALADGSGLNTNAVSASNIATNAITLGYAEMTTTFATTSTSPVLVTGLTIAVTIPSGGRRVKITAYAGSFANTTGGQYAAMTLWDGTVGSGTQLAQSNAGPSANTNQGTVAMAVKTPSAGAKTYNVGLSTTSGTATIAGIATNPAFILVEAI